uniref:Uncharacterized protein n=1 Tax=Timema monikensis TaxID=170555 RepID=A0A7R9HRP0_9NEOP|nr:unnamed protein product [Timema monikensis]
MSSRLSDGCFNRNVSYRHILSRRKLISWVLLFCPPPFLQHHLEGKLQRGRVAVVDVADHTVSLVFDLVHDTRDVHCSAPVNNTRNASFGGTRLRGGRVENNFDKTTFSIPEQDTKPDLPVIGSLV